MENPCPGHAEPGGHRHVQPGRQGRRCDVRRPIGGGGPYGNVVSKADDQEQLIIVDIDLTQTAAARKQRPFLELRRPEWYD